MPKHKTPTVNPTPTLNSVLRDAVVTALTEHLEQLSGSEPTNIYRLVLDEVERPMLEVMMRFADYNQQKAAKYLGINRATLRTKLKRHGLITDVTSIDVTKSRAAQPLPAQQQQSNADTHSQAQKFKFLWSYKPPEMQWAIANTPDEGEYEEMMGLGIKIDKTYHDNGGKAVVFADGSIYRSVYWSMK